MTFAPLKGMRILDLTSVVVGPVTTSRLAQYGAEVIKLENPEGDLMRGLGGQSPTGEHSGTYLHLNRGKRNICCNLKTSAGREVLDKLVASADAVIANLRPQALDRLGVGPDQVCSRYPDKVYCLITGYGSQGPYAGQPTYDSVIQAASGVTGLFLQRDGAPAYVPMVVCDHVVGEIASGAVVAALMQKQATGVGCKLEVPMFETMSAFMLQEHLAQHSFDPPVGPAGDRRLLSPHNRPVKTADGWISFTVNTDKQVRAFLEVSGRGDLVDDTRFNSVSARADNVMAWFEVRGAPLQERTTSEWLELMQAADIACKPCHTIDTLPNDPHLTAVGLLHEDDHPTEGRTIAIRPSILVNEASLPMGSCAQPKGWDSAAVLREIGFDDDAIEAMISEGTIVARQ
jgi:crotonobetainyl-CoA:carnitine CoA-transferase CaiB-like acyl-CoA transferase